jgi:hypothetical protein
MTERDLSSTWAWAQIEAWADGSLTGESRERMAQALRADAQLRAAVDRAAAVRDALRADEVAPLPAGLRRRLLAIPGAAQRPMRRFVLPAAAAAVTAVAVSVWLARPVPAPEREALLALQELELAMRYVQKSARIAEDEVTGAVGTGFRKAFDTSREVLGRRNEESGG